MKLSLIISQNCSACVRVETVLRNIALQYSNIVLNIINANDYNGKGISIVPALFINDELFSYGDIDEL